MPQGSGYAGKQRRRRERDEQTLTAERAAGSNKIPENFRVSRFVDADFIMGVTLWRFWHRQDLAEPGSTEDYYLVYKPPEYAVERGCDGCVRNHHEKNIACSANTHSAPRYIDHTRLYRFGGRPGRDCRFEVVSEVIHRAAKVCGMYIRTTPI